MSLFVPLLEFNNIEGGLNQGEVKKLSTCIKGVHLLPLAFQVTISPYYAGL